MEKAHNTNDNISEPNVVVDMNKPADDNKHISRRKAIVHLVSAASSLLIIGYVGYRVADEIKMDTSYPTSSLVEDMPTLREIILSEGEEYFSLPDDNSRKVESLEEVNDVLYPQVIDSVNKYIGKEISYPTLQELTFINYNSLIFGGAAALWYGAFSLIQNRVKENIKGQIKFGKYIGSVCFLLESVLNVLLTRGVYNKTNGKISVYLGDSETMTKKYIAHELAHYLFFSNVKDSYPNWIIEGFAESFSHEILRQSGMLKEKKSDVRKYGLEQLVTTYRAICIKENLTTGLSKEFDEFDFAPLGFRNPDDYSMGYSFFRMRERQKGADIYKRILDTGNLSVVSPIPANP